MEYNALSKMLRESVDFDRDRIALATGQSIRNFDFRSAIRHPYPPGTEADDALAAAAGSDGTVLADLLAVVNTPDLEITENFAFRYHLLLPAGVERAERVIVLFHGFNERSWHKYLPWASFMAEKTGSAVLLFPIAFHMNRAPAAWTDIRAMNRVSKLRRRVHPAVIDSSLSNVAISIRLHYRPERFIWSGLQSYYDVIDMIEAIRSGGHPAIRPEAAVDFFSYSVGSFLGLALMMTNPQGWFSRSRYAMFCGGPVFNRLSPVSKFILDSEASVRLYSYLVEHLESHMRDHAELRRVLDGDLEEGINFRSLLNYRDNLKYREEKLRGLQDRLYAVALADDAVVPAYEVIHTLRGSRQDIAIPVDIVDFPYPYRHEDPFPVGARQTAAVDAGFRDVFGRVSDFLARG